MGKGRARSAPDRPDAVWDALPVDVQAGIEAAARELSVPIARWDEVPELVDLMLTVAIRRRVHHHERRDRLTKRAAFLRVATAFGLTEGAVRGSYYGFENRRRDVLPPLENRSRPSDGKPS